MDAVARWCLCPFKLIFCFEHSFRSFSFVNCFICFKGVRKSTFKGRAATAASMRYCRDLKKDQLCLIFTFPFFYHQSLEKIFQLLDCCCLLYLLNPTIFPRKMSGWEHWAQLSLNWMKILYGLTPLRPIPQMY